MSSNKFSNLQVCTQDHKHSKHNLASASFALLFVQNYAMLDLGDKISSGVWWIPKCCFFTALKSDNALVVCIHRCTTHICSKRQYTQNPDMLSSTQVHSCQATFSSMPGLLNFSNCLNSSAFANARTSSSSNCVFI